VLKKSNRIGANQDSTVEPLPEGVFGRRKPPEVGRFWLQVDRQTKTSYRTREAAEEAGLAIKRGFPILHVTVFDAEEGQSQAIVLPAT
jgi:hypothetical protein